ncbi:response regulator [Reichenbachiella ulvae]|uniref:Response regulator transcription factor n=1 Tax=Reichenbachiella ulvae TaxID=2980104 RepID=A0ABT3CSK7_9BACT|nr:response regulator transcription factor [Reichenbachiella ulvae]MCV9386494.1 response regulator transcription factor [Reichenbachiella ulvae]
MNKKKLFLIDDHKVVRNGVKAMLLARMDIQVVGEASSGREALVSIADYQPDLVFVDLKLPDANGAELIGELKELVPNAVFGLLTAEPGAADLERAKINGALAFLTKDMDTSEYLKAIDHLLLGKIYISSAFSAVMMESTDASYTPREMEVLQGFADGLSYKEIGARLGMSARTVETHKNSLLKKMEVKSIVEMVRKAIRDGHITA